MLLATVAAILLIGVVGLLVLLVGDGNGDRGGRNAEVRGSSQVSNPGNVPPVSTETFLLVSEAINLYGGQNPEYETPTCDLMRELLDSALDYNESTAEIDRESVIAALVDPRSGLHVSLRNLGASTVNEDEVSAAGSACAGQIADTL